MDNVWRDPETGKVTKTAQRFIPEGYTGEHYTYWFANKHNWGCYPVKFQTPYQIVVADDYKRCMCKNFGKGEDDCKQQGITLSKE